MKSQKCSYCNTVYMDDPKLTSTYDLVFDQYHKEYIFVSLQLCPNCNKVSVFVTGSGFGNPVHFCQPPLSAMYLPEYIPDALRQDYLEAIAISDLSPKASATLARRCLQGMIHDFWNIKEKNLNAEITSLKSKIPAKQWAAIDALRKIGNIGAHMEKDAELLVDVDPDEAKKLLKVIELLFKNWYIASHEDEQLYDEVNNMALNKEATRSTETVSGGKQLPIQ